jgi:hypothetical protein
VGRLRLEVGVTVFVVCVLGWRWGLAGRVSMGALVDVCVCGGGGGMGGEVAVVLVAQGWARKT